MEQSGLNVSLKPTSDTFKFLFFQGVIPLNPGWKRMGKRGNGNWKNGMAGGDVGREG